MKRCPRCQVEKPDSEWYWRKSGAPSSYCKPCNAEDHARYYRANKERLLAQHAAWVRENEDHLKAYRDARRDKTAAIAREWARANRKRRQASQKGRLARKRAVPTDITTDEVMRLMKARKCRTCGCYMTKARGPRQRHLDHIVPLNVGGPHTRSNVRVICATCNLTRPKDGRDVAHQLPLLQVA